MLYASTTHDVTDIFGLDRGLSYLLDAGYPALDFSFFSSKCDFVYQDDWQETADRARSLVEGRGSSFFQAHAPFGGLKDYYLEKCVSTFPRVFEFASRLGVKVIVVHPLMLPRTYGHQQEILDINIKFYRELAPLAQKNGLTIAIENIWEWHPFKETIVDSSFGKAEELCSIYDALNDPSTFTICLDVGHVALCGREPQDAIRTIGHDRLGALHVHDVDYRHDLHTLPGVSRLPWNDICQALADIRYKGCFTLEADNFLKNFDPDFVPTACKFMADTARFLSSKVSSLMK